MAKYNKFWVACGGVLLMVGLRYLEVDIPGLNAVVSDLVIGALVAGGVYQVPNLDA